MKKGYYTATAERGVEFYGETLENPEIEVLSPIEFLYMLDRLGDEDEIFTFFDDSVLRIYDEIEIVYGIRT